MHKLHWGQNHGLIVVVLVSTMTHCSAITQDGMQLRPEQLQQHCVTITAGLLPRLH